MLSRLLIGMLTLALNIQPVKADWTWTETIYIRADGSVDPDTAPISSVDNITYTFKDNIVGDVPKETSAIVVERDNIVVDGAGYTLQGTQASFSQGIYLLSRSNVTIKNTEIKSFCNGIGLRYSSNNSIFGNNITNNFWFGSGIYFYYSSNCTISKNNVIDNYFGIGLDGSSTNTISGNNITENNDCGIFLAIFSNNNTITGNNIIDSHYGIDLLRSSTNTISGNNIANNDYGIVLDRSSNNSIDHNNFMDNSKQVYSSVSTNVLDDGYPSGGNYWSDYTGIDADGDGIGDTPYVIDANNQDRYPLMEPWSVRMMIKSLIRTVVFWNLPKGTENSLTSKPEEALHLLEIGNENGAVHKLMDFINQVEAQRDKKLTNEQADQLIAEAQTIIDLING